MYQDYNFVSSLFICLTGINKKPSPLFESVTFTDSPYPLQTHFIQYRPNLSITDPLYPLQTHLLHYFIPTVSITDPLYTFQTHFTHNRSILFSTDPLYPVQTHYVVLYTLQNHYINFSDYNNIEYDPSTLSLTKMLSLTLICLKINNVVIKQVNEARFLGVTLDENLNWKSHIYKLSKKLSCSAGILNLIKDSIPEDLYKSLYFTLFESHLSYGITVWGGVSNNKL